jgi:hypothetical protein
MSCSHKNTEGAARPSPAGATVCGQGRQPLVAVGAGFQGPEGRQTHRLRRSPLVTHYSLLITHHPSLLSAGLLAALLTAGPASAQQPPPGKDPLASKEEIARDRMTQLEDRMFRLIEKLAQSEPDQAERLRAALRKSRELLIRQHMDDVVKLLDEKNLTEASDRQKALVRDLNAVLKLLMENSVDLQERQKQVEALKAFRDRVARLIAEEMQHRSLSEQARQADEALRRIQNAVRQIELLIQRERTAIEKTADAMKQPQAEAPAMATVQAGIRADTEKVADDLGRMGEAATSQPTSTRPGRAETRPADAPTASRPALGPAQEHLQRAAAQMKDAEAPLSEGRLPRAKENQERSIESLRKALEELKQQADKLESQSGLSKLAEGQRGTASKTGKLADDMSGRSDGKQGGQQGDPKGSPKDGRPGGQEGGQQGGQQGGQSQPPAPGQENVEQARQQMDKAADDLKGNKPGDANTKQQDAVKRLSEAKKQLEEQLNQLRREQQEEVLRAIEDRFRDMLARQLQINQNTISLDKKGLPNWTRTEELLAGTLAQGERDLGGDASKALDILRQEGTTLVFPQIVEQLASDFGEAGERIGDKNVAAATQQLQAEIVETLKELIEAVSQMRKKMQSGEAPGGTSSQQQTPPLLPESAELKLLRACQQRVNRQTETFNKERGNEKALTPDEQHRLDRIAERQKDVAAMAQEMNERAMNR